jgi:hypothetical protein
MNFRLVTKELDIILGVVDNGRRLRSNTPRPVTFQSCRHAVDETKEQGLPRDDRLEVLLGALLKQQMLSAGPQSDSMPDNDSDRENAELASSNGQLQRANIGGLVRPFLPNATLRVAFAGGEIETGAFRCCARLGAARPVRESLSMRLGPEAASIRSHCWARPRTTPG